MSYTTPSNVSTGTLITAASFNRTTYQLGDVAPVPGAFASLSDFYEAYRLWHRAQRLGLGDPVGALIRDEIVRIRAERGLE